MHLLPLHLLYMLHPLNLLPEFHVAPARVRFAPFVLLSLRGLAEESTHDCCYQAGLSDIDEDSFAEAHNEVSTVSMALSTV